LKLIERNRSVPIKILTDQLHILMDISVKISAGKHEINLVENNLLEKKEDNCLGPI
jgi:hypothetical protein